MLELLLLVVCSVSISPDAEIWPTRSGKYTTRHPSYNSPLHKHSGCPAHKSTALSLHLEELEKTPRGEPQNGSRRIHTSTPYHPYHAQNPATDQTTRNNSRNDGPASLKARTTTQQNCTTPTPGPCFLQLAHCYRSSSQLLPQAWHNTLRTSSGASFLPKVSALRVPTAAPPEQQQ